MSLSTYFEEFCEEIYLDNLEQMKITTGNIAKKLNKVYYDLEKDTESHMYIVGSVGRETAVKNTSDLDLLFDLPGSVFEKYNNYESNGQSQLLQEIKKVLKESYPKTKISGDGQVIVIEFSAYTVELVPAFKQDDSRFKYPDTHDGGSWKYTDPFPEQEAAQTADELSKNNYRRFCRLIRKWKNISGASMGGLLIDTLVYNHFNQKEYYSDKDFEDYYQILINVFKYLKNQDSEKKYWKALGSHQHIPNSNKTNFINKAKKAFEKLNNAQTEEEKINVLKELLGDKFAPNVETSLSGKAGEEFIENLYRVDIKYNLIIDCYVTQNGWRSFWLRSNFRKGQKYLPLEKHLEFTIKSCDVKPPYKILWKVRNVGTTAEKRGMIRGQIIKSNKDHQTESTDFEGPHFVECYIIKDEVCVARDRISVNISTKV